MTDHPHTLICARCSNPMHVIVREAGRAQSVVNCPYCHAENACELGGSLEAKPIEPQEQTYFWNNETRRDATCGLDLNPPKDVGKAGED